MHGYELDLNLHLTSYRDSLRREVPPYAADYASLMATKDPASYRSVHDYLFQKLRDTKDAAAYGDIDAYRVAITLHQDGFLSLLEAMIADEMWDYKQVNKENLQALLKNRGWQWFKYSRYGFRSTMPIGKRSIDVAFLPRYSLGIIQEWDGKTDTYFDATEIGLLFPGEGKPGPSQRDLEDILKFKVANPAEKILEISWADPPILKHLSIAKLNDGPLVYDWSLPLWY